MSALPSDGNDLRDPPSSAEADRAAPGAFRDERLAPEVDRQLLRALVRQELTVDTARTVYRLIHSFRSWNEAHAELLIEEFRRTHRKGDGPAFP